MNRFFSNFKIWREKEFRVGGKTAHFQKIKDRTFTHVLEIMR